MYMLYKIGFSVDLNMFTFIACWYFNEMYFIML